MTIIDSRVYLLWRQGYKRNSYIILPIVLHMKENIALLEIIFMNSR